MAFWAAALVATRSPSAASLSLCCWSSFSGYAAAPWEHKHTQKTGNVNVKGGGVVWKWYEKCFLCSYLKKHSYSWVACLHFNHIIHLLRWAGIWNYPVGANRPLKMMQTSSLHSKPFPSNNQSLCWWLNVNNRCCLFISANSSSFFFFFLNLSVHESSSTGWLGHSTHGETDKPAAIRLINWEPRSITCSSTKSRMLLKTCVIKVILNLTGAAGRSFHWDITTNKEYSNTGAGRKISHFAL